MHKRFRYRIYPSGSQEHSLLVVLEECRWLYNRLLEHRKQMWDDFAISISLYDQIVMLPGLKVERPSLSLIHSQVLQNVAMRVDFAFNGFFRRVKAKEKPGFPRFRGPGGYDSFCFTQFGFGIEGKILKLSKIGRVHLVLHRPIEGRAKTATIRRTPTGKWYVTFACEVEPQRLPDVQEQVGIDVGLASFATLSTGEVIDNPRFFRRDEKALKRAQSKFSKEAKGTAKRRRRRKAAARVCERIRHRRHNFAHQHSRSIINRFQVIAVEDLDINQMRHNHCLAKSISDAAWNEFTRYLSYKAESAGRSMVCVNPAYTSQTCSSCGHRQKMPLNQRTFACPCCSVVLDRDHNAALNIRALGLQSLRLVPESPLV